VSPLHPTEIRFLTCAHVRMYSVTEESKKLFLIMPLLRSYET